LRFQKLPAYGIERTSVPRGVLQHPEPHQFRLTERGYQLADIQPDIVGGATAAGAVRAQVFVLNERLARDLRGARGKKTRADEPNSSARPSSRFAASAYGRAS